MRGLRRWQGSLGTGLLLGLWLTCTQAGRSQDTPAEPAAASVPAPAPRVLAGDATPAGQPVRPGPALIPPIMELSPEPVAEPAAEEAGEPLPPPSPWIRVPPVRLFPRLGYFLIGPTGPGYYSLRDVLEHHARPAPPFYPYPPQSLKAYSFFDADFRYLERPDNTQHDWLDPLKRVHLCDNWLFSNGGEVRFRQMNEVDRQLTGLDNNYQLYRTRLFGDLWYRDQFRVFVEYIDARSFNEDLPSLTIDENQNDLLNAFVDLKLAEPAGKPGYLRVGRQELLLGSERLISPLEWANARRTFQGLKAFRQGEHFDVDLFWVQPVIPNAGDFDSVDDDQNFVGVWTTYRRQRGRFLDLYFLNLDQARRVPTVGNVPGSFNVSTLGWRWCGDYQGRFLWDTELMTQWGRRVNQDICAGACTGGLGYHFADLPMDPQFWVYYDWASGDQSPGRGAVYGTFNQLFAFGHYYLGYLDLVGRQNIQDVSTQFALYPVPWVLFLTQFHHFELASSRDALYNAAGAPIRRDPSGRAGRHVGEEIDLLLNVHLSAHQDVLLGYSKLFAGRFIKQTGNPGSPELFYAQYQFRW